MPDKPRERQDAGLWAAHQQMKGELLAEVARRTGVHAASVAMSPWRFSSDRQVEDHVARMYARAG